MFLVQLQRPQSLRDDMEFVNMGGVDTSVGGHWVIECDGFSPPNSVGQLLVETCRIAALG